MDRWKKIAVGAATSAILVLGSLTAAQGASAAQTCTTKEGARMCVGTTLTNGRIRGTASIRDLAGGPNLNVAVTNIRLQNYRNGRWVTIRESYDYDGWPSTSDSGSTTSVNPCAYANPVFRTVAYHRWQGGQQGSYTLNGIQHWYSYC